MSGKKPPSINLRASLAMSSPAVPSTTSTASTIDPESFLRGDRKRSLPLSQIERNTAAQPRLRLDPSTVEAYREAMTGPDGTPAWGTFPSVVVFGKDDHYYLADGFHRIAAAEAAGLSQVSAEVHLGGLREAILHSVGANAAHGLRRTNEDKRRAVETLLHDKEWSTKSDRWIAERASVSPDTVGRIRRELGLSLSGSDSASQVRVGKDGRTQNITQIGRSRSTQVSGDTRALSESDSAPVASLPARSGRRSSQSTAAFESLIKSLQAAEPDDGTLSLVEVRQGLIAFAQWGAGGDAKKARTFLRKLGARIPREMAPEPHEPVKSGVRPAR